MVAGGHKDPRSVDFYAEIDQQSATKVLRFVRKDEHPSDTRQAPKSVAPSRPAS